jgi:hypothetical protein
MASKRNSKLTNCANLTGSRLVLQHLEGSVDLELTHEACCTVRLDTTAFWGYPRHLPPLLTKRPLP